MTIMRNQEQELVDRTINNLDFVLANKHRESVWEVTQTINSFLCVVAHPRERLLDPEKIKWLKLDDEFLRSSGLPRVENSWEYDREEPRTLGHLLRLLRNGIAHGNVDLLDEHELRAYRPEVPLPAGLLADEIAAVEIWNEDNNGRTWGTILTIDEIDAMLRAIAGLVSDPALHRANMPPKTGGRKQPQQRQQPLRRRERSGVQASAQSPLIASDGAST